jgi:hypothetical protein
MLAVIGAGIQIALILLSEYFKARSEKKKKIEEILKEVGGAKSASEITRVFSRINRLK